MGGRGQREGMCELHKPNRGPCGREVGEIDKMVWMATVGGNDQQLPKS